MAAEFDQALFLKFLAALLALLNPLYAIPIFLGLTSGFTPSERTRTAIVVTLTVTVTALAALLAGEEILGVFGIDIASFRVAGGIIILAIALAMMNAEEPSAGDAAAASEAHARRNIAVVPLSIPLIIGPGTIATAIVAAHQLSDLGEIVTLVPVVLIVGLLIGVALRFADPIQRLLGKTGLSVISRIMAIILAAVAVEMILSGLADAARQHFPALGASASS